MLLFMEPSEGSSLTQDDEKVYWGKITEVIDNQNTVDGKITVEGSVMVAFGPFGFGTTLAKFKMTQIEDILDETHQESDDGDIKPTNVDSIESFMDSSCTNNEDETDQFELPGAFE